MKHVATFLKFHQQAKWTVDSSFLRISHCRSPTPIENSFVICEHFLKSMSRWKKSTSMCTFDSLTLNMCQVQVAALYVWPPTSAPLQGIWAKWTSWTEINEVSPRLQLYLTNKSCRQCWCSPMLYRWCQPSVCDCRQQCDRWKELCRTNRRKSFHFHIFKLKCQNVTSSDICFSWRCDHGSP